MLKMTGAFENRVHLPNETWYKAEICKLACSHRVLTMECIGKLKI